MRIGELAKRSAVPEKTLRYYDSIGLLRPRYRDPRTRYREYGEDALHILVLIQAAKEAGLTLAQIRSVLESAKAGSPYGAMVRLLDERIRQVERALTKLKRFRREVGRGKSTGAVRPRTRG